VQIVEVGVRLNRWKGTLVCVEGRTAKDTLKEEVPSYDPASPGYVCGREEVVECDDVSTSDVNFEVTLNGNDNQELDPASEAAIPVDNNSAVSTYTPYSPGLSNTAVTPKPRRRRGDEAKKSARETKEMISKSAIAIKGDGKNSDTDFIEHEHATAKRTEVKAADDAMKAGIDTAPEDSSTRGKLTCLDCGKSFARESSLQAHATIHTGERPYHCESCGKTFRLKYILELHKNTVHSEDRPFACELCGKLFKLRMKLDEHMRTHTGVRPHACETCGARFASKSDVKKHLRFHTGEKPFKCATCGKFFHTSSNLKTHELTHSGAKPFHCQFCGKLFSRKGNLMEHCRGVHLDEKPFRCSNCALGFRRKKMLSEHQLSCRLNGGHPGDGKSVPTQQQPQQKQQQQPEQEMATLIHEKPCRKPLPTFVVANPGTTSSHPVDAEEQSEPTVAISVPSSVSHDLVATTNLPHPTVFRLP